MEDTHYTAKEPNTIEANSILWDNKISELNHETFMNLLSQFEDKWSIKAWNNGKEPFQLGYRNWFDENDINEETGQPKKFNYSDVEGEYRRIKDKLSLMFNRADTLGILNFEENDDEYRSACSFCCFARMYAALAPAPAIPEGCPDGGFAYFSRAALTALRWVGRPPDGGGSTTLLLLPAGGLPFGGGTVRFCVRSSSSSYLLPAEATAVTSSSSDSSQSSYLDDMTSTGKNTEMQVRRGRGCLSRLRL